MFRVTNACLVPTISLTRFLINQLGCSVWNHLVSQKTWQNDSDLVLSDQHVLRVTNACVVRAKQHTTRANATTKHLYSRHQNRSARAKTRINYSSKRKHKTLVKHTPTTYDSSKTEIRRVQLKPNH